jgi:hypothetical protein
MNGGAWLTVGGQKVDVLLRDADFVEHCTARVERGEYDVDGLLAYLAGVPTYSLAAERHAAVVLRGEAPRRIEFPALLAEQGAVRWRFHRRFTMEQAKSRAARGDAIGATGQVARAAIEEAHARLCERRQWVLNEKRIIERAGMDRVAALFAELPQGPTSLVTWVADVGAALERS